MYNKVILVGNLTRDVEVRYSQSGSAIGKVGIATSRKFKSATGEQKEEVMFIDLTFFGRTAEIANQYLRKGSKVLVEGRLILEQWVAQDGSKRSRHSVTVESMKMLDNRDSQSNNAQTNQAPQNGYSAPQQPPNNGYISNNGEANSTPQQPSIPEIDINNEDIPF